MFKYIVHRLEGEADGADEPVITASVTIAVEYGENILAVTDTLIEAIKEDALGLDKYQKGFTASVYAPEEENDGLFAYTMTAALEPAYGEQNDLVYYGIVVEGGAEG
jgi:hypothetical protein